MLYSWLGGRQSEVLYTIKTARVVENGESFKNRNRVGRIAALWPASWLIDNGKLLIRTYQLPDKSIRASCPSGTTCTLLRQLVWTLISDNGTEVTVIEQYSSAEGAGTARLSRYSRASP